MRHFIICRLIALACTCLSLPCLGYQQIIPLTVPSIHINQQAQITKSTFADHIQQLSSRLSTHANHPLLGIAPMGGTKLSAFKELNLDGLVIIDWDRAGSPSLIEKTFTDTSLHAGFISALEESINNGSMSTSTVMRAPVSAQIIAKLYYEFGVSAVRVQYYSTQTETDLSAWDGDPVRDTDSPLITRFTFSYHDQPKELLFISSKLTADSVTWRDPLPAATLQQLAPKGFDWAYLSADGLVFFSKKADNGARRANEALLQLLTVNGSILLDYPQLNAYTACSPNNINDGIASMCGRGDLETWGMTLAGRLAINTNVFGYVGLAAGDEVRLYTKQAGNQNRRDTSSNIEIFNVTGLQQIGDDYIFKLGETS